MAFYEKGLYSLFDDTCDKTLRLRRFCADDLFNLILMFNRNKFLQNFGIKSGIPDDGCFGYYKLSNKTIVLYAQAIVAKKIEELKTKPSEILVPMVYFDLIRSLIHEIEHTKQFELIHSRGRNNFLKQLLLNTIVNDEDYIRNLSIRLLNEQNIEPSLENINLVIKHLEELWSNIYNKYYDELFFERMADIDTYLFLERLFKDKSKYKICFDYANVSKVITTTRGYSFSKTTGIISPTVFHMEQLKKNKFIKNIPFSWYSPNYEECLIKVSELYDFKTRLRYGLPLSLNEYYTLINVAHNKSENFEKTYKIKLK